MLSASTTAPYPSVGAPASDEAYDVPRAESGARSCRTHPRDRPCYVAGWRALRDGEWREVRCRSFRCATDQWRAVGRVSRAIAEAVLSYEAPRLVTLTYRHRDEMWRTCRSCESAELLQAGWNRLRLMIARRYGRAAAYVRVREWTEAGIAHYHLIVDAPVDQAWLTYAWHRATEWSSYIVDVQWIRRSRWAVVHYISSYLASGLAAADGEAAGKGAPRGLRRYSASRGTRLWPAVEPPDAVRDARGELVAIAGVGRLRLLIVEAGLLGQARRAIASILEVVPPDPPPPSRHRGPFRPCDWCGRGRLGPPCDREREDQSIRRYRRQLARDSEWLRARIHRPPADPWDEEVG